MKKTYQDFLLRIIKAVNVALLTVPFAAVWYVWYSNQLIMPYNDNKNYLIIGLFIVLYSVFGKIYEGFMVSMKRISELVYSQALAAVAADGIMFLVTWLLAQTFPNVLPMLVVVAMQIFLSIIWSFVITGWYFKVFPPRATAVVYDVRQGLEKLVKAYGLDKKYDVQLKLWVDECLADLSVLKNMKTVFISGVHSHERNIILKYCVAENIEVLVIPRIGDVIMSGAKSIHMFHLPMLKVQRYNASLEYLAVKRAMDMVLSLFALIVLSPIMLVVAIAIKAYDGGPVLYSQVRLTKDNKKFNIHKFRSMRVDAESDGVARLSTGDKDDRITPVGKIIRKLRLDELPQLFDILCGNLSICGPRPERPEIAEQYMEEMPEFALRLQAKAGLTGYAQVYGKYNTTPYDKLQMDLMYIAHPSIIEDIKIMMATVKILFMPESTEGVDEGQTTAIEMKI